MLRAAKQTDRRPGFTLVELLVVIAIISILVSLSAAAVLRLIGTQQSANTKAELTHLKGQFQKEWSAAASRFQGEPLPPPAGSALYNAYQTVLNMAAGDANQATRSRVIWVKMRLKQTFPNNFNEALNPAPMPPLSTYVKILRPLGYNPGRPIATQPWESGACLLMALQRGEDNTSVTQEELGVSSQHDFSTPNGQTIKGLVDGWGKPIYFVRWPVMLSIPANNQSGQSLQLTGQPQNGFNDAGDPTGLLAAPNWRGSSNYTQFMMLGHPLAAHAAGTEPQTYRIVPIIASGGPNNRLGYDNGPPGVNPSAGFDPSTVQTQPGSADADDLFATLQTP